MTRAKMSPSLPLQTIAPRRPLIAALVVRFARVTSVWITRRRTRKHLSELDDHMLKDIGITRTQARKEAARPFWHG